jgi:drug/metabolite transporter (DMT)-like permease
MFSKGVQYMLIATVCFAGMNVFVKLVSHIPPVEIVFFRSLVSFFMSYIMLKSQNVSVWVNRTNILIGRGLVGAVSLSIYFYTLQQIPLASAITIQYLSPIFTAILGIFLLKEKVKPLQWIFFAISFGGVVMIQGFDARVSLGLASLGLVAAFFAGLVYMFVRKLSHTEHPLVIVFYFPLVTLPLSGAYCLFDWVHPEGWDWLILLLIGVLTQIAQFYMTKAYQEEVLAKVAPVKYLGIFFAILFGLVIFGENYALLAYGGMVLVLVGVVLNVWYKTLDAGR